MIFPIFGHQAPREPLLFLLWMTLAIASSTSGAIRLDAERISSRGRKPSHTKRDETKALAANLHTQHEFPYRYVFPANHPYSTYTQFLTRPVSTQNYDIYPHQSHNYQNSYPPTQEYRYKIKHQQPQPTYQINAQNLYSPNTLPVTQVPVNSQPSPAPLILLVHTGPSGNGANGPFQTFVLVPADGSNQQHHQHVSNLAAAFAGGSVPNLQPAQQLPSLQPYGNVAAVPSSPNVMPITQVPPLVLFRPSHHTKNSNSNNHPHGLLQRPISIYPMPNQKYYPYKKNAVESRMSEKESSKKQTTSTEATSSYLTTRS